VWAGHLMSGNKVCIRCTLKADSSLIFFYLGYFYSASSSLLLLLFGGAPDYSIDTVLEFHAEAPRAIASEGLAQGPYAAAGVGFEPATLGSQGAELTTEPPHPEGIRQAVDVEQHGLCLAIARL